MRLLLLSNSKVEGMGYLAWAVPALQALYAGGPRSALFIPYANAAGQYDAYEAKAAPAFAQVGVHLQSIHHHSDPVAAVRQAESLVVGGGSTWKLLRDLRAASLLGPLAEQVRAGRPYVGWSAGANMACPTLATTNDMPICDPQGFGALNLVPFQINPHYLHGNPPGFKGETREERLIEFGHLNPDTWVAGLREGTGLAVTDGQVQLIGDQPCRVFKHGLAPQELGADADFQVLMNSLPPRAA